MKYSIAFICFILALAAYSSTIKNYDASGIFETTEVIVSNARTCKILTFNIIKRHQILSLQLLGIVDTKQLFFQKVQLQQRKKQSGARKQDVTTQLAFLEEQLAYRQRKKIRVEKRIETKVGNTKLLDDINTQIAIIQKQITPNNENMEKKKQSISNNVSVIDTQIDKINNQNGSN